MRWWTACWLLTGSSLVTCCATPAQAQVTTYKYTWVAPDQTAPNGAAVAPGNPSSSFGSTSPPDVATQSAPDGEQAASDQGTRGEPAPPPPHEHHDQAGSPPHRDEDKSDIVVPLAISLVLTTVSLVIGSLVWWSRRRRRRLRGTGGSEDGKDWPTSQTDPDGAIGASEEQRYAVPTFPMPPHMLFSPDVTRSSRGSDGGKASPAFHTHAPRIAAVSSDASKHADGGHSTVSSRLDRNGRESLAAESQSQSERRTWDHATGIRTSDSQAFDDLDVVLASSHLSTISEVEPKKRLVLALENLATATPPRVFAGQYTLLNERVTAGQGLVNFARSATGGMQQFAIKFFYAYRDYHEELAVYSDPLLRPTLPPIFHASTNDDQDAVLSESGFRFPPYIVLERGITGEAWAEHPRRFGEQLTMLEQLAEMLATLHGAGKAHRDIKPSNVIWMLNSTAWRLLDFGIVAAIGERAFPRCTPLYAAPEVMRALGAEEAIEVAAAHDIWALGVITYEVIIGRPAFPRRFQASLLHRCADGRTPYPWEAPPEQQEPLWRRSRLRALVSECLTRDAAARPTAAGVVESIVRMSSATAVGDTGTASGAAA